MREIYDQEKKYQSRALRVYPNDSNTIVGNTSCVLSWPPSRYFEHVGRLGICSDFQSQLIVL